MPGRMAKIFDPSKTIREDGINRLLQYLGKRDLRKYFLVYLAKAMGLRLTEVVCMRIEDFAEYLNGRGKIILRVAKKGILKPKQRAARGMKTTGYRSAWNERELVPYYMIDKTIEVCRKFFKWAKIDPRKHRGWVFPGTSRGMSPHGHVSERQVHEWFTRATKACGIGRKTFHCLRHYRGFKVQSMHKDITVTQQELRHSSVLITQIYTERTPEERRALIQKIGD